MTRQEMEGGGRKETNEGTEKHSFGKSKRMLLENLAGSEDVTQVAGACELPLVCL